MAEDGRFYVRLSLMIPREGMQEQALAIHRTLVAGLASQPGFVRGYVITGDRWGRVGHLNIYTSEHEADQAAQTQHILALRSEMLMLIVEESHIERSYEVYDPQVA
jgi:quinol monooxygenase YgiN